MESWKHAFRNGFCPLLSTAALDVLARALRLDDPDLIQGATCDPVPLQRNAEEPIERCCAIAYCGWKTEDLQTVQALDDWFTHVCFEAGKRLGDPSFFQFFTGWFDDEPWQQVRQQLLAEVNRELDRRRGLPVAA